MEKFSEFVCIISATVIAATGHDGWPWFLLVGILLG
jgi:hypothetical protein